MHYKGEFSPQWKKANPVTVFKKNDKKIMTNCKSISQFLVWSKTLEKIIYYDVIECLTASRLVSENQSGFKPADSFINQPSAITH